MSSPLLPFSPQGRLGLKFDTVKHLQLALVSSAEVGEPPGHLSLPHNFLDLLQSDAGVQTVIGWAMVKEILDGKGLTSV